MPATKNIIKWPTTMSRQTPLHEKNWRFHLHLRNLDNFLQNCMYSTPMTLNIRNHQHENMTHILLKISIDTPSVFLRSNRPHCPMSPNIAPATKTDSHDRPSSHTSSTAQGGGRSFKNRKPIGEIGRCESPMAEQKH